MTHIVVGLLAGVCFAGLSGVWPSDPRQRKVRTRASTEPARATLVLESAEYHAAHGAGPTRDATQLVMMRDGQRALIDYMPLHR